MNFLTALQFREVVSSARASHTDRVLPLCRKETAGGRRKSPRTKAQSPLGRRAKQSPKTRLLDQSEVSAYDEHRAVRGGKHAVGVASEDDALDVRESARPHDDEIIVAALGLLHDDLSRLALFDD